jgi:hypothetical protein
MTAPVITVLDIAADLDDITWEWSVECAIRKDLVTMSAMTAEIDHRATLHRPGVGRARRVLALRPPNARATGSQLETEFIQLIRPVEEIPEEERHFPWFGTTRSSPGSMLPFPKCMPIPRFTAPSIGSRCHMTPVGRLWSQRRSAGWSPKSPVGMSATPAG